MRVCDTSMLDCAQMRAAPSLWQLIVLCEEAFWVERIAVDTSPEKTMSQIKAPACIYCLKHLVSARGFH